MLAHVQAVDTRPSSLLPRGLGMIEAILILVLILATSGVQILATSRVQILHPGAKYYIRGSKWYIRGSKWYIRGSKCYIRGPNTTPGSKYYTRVQILHPGSKYYIRGPNTTHGVQILHPGSKYYIRGPNTTHGVQILHPGSRGVHWALNRRKRAELRQQAEHAYFEGSAEAAVQPRPRYGMVVQLMLSYVL